MRLLKAIVIGLALAFGSSAVYAQCTGQPPSGRLCANGTGSGGLPSWYTQSVVLDVNFGNPSVQGTILNRGASLWSSTSSPALGLNGTAGGSLTLNGSTSGSALISTQAAAGTATLFQLPNTNGTNAFVLTTDGSGHLSWTNPAAGGTVTSVGLALPASILTVSGSPVTITGTLTGTLATQSANLVWAGPTTGSAATPTFRSLVGADLPNPAPSTLGGVESLAAVASNWIRAISTSGVPTASQPAFTDISGTVAAAQLPNPTASTLGGVESLAAVTSKWINTISTSGVPSATQPNFTDLSGSASLAQLPSISNSSVLGNNSGGTAIPASLSASNVLDMINNVQGDILYRDVSGWLVLPPGTNGQVLTTAGAAANPAWTTVTGTGTVTSVATNNGITGGTITTTGTIGLAAITSHGVLANITGGSAVPIANTPSSILDIIGAATGDILYRSSGSGWQVLAPGTNGQVLTQGASTPAWGNAGTLTNVTIAAGTGIGVTGTCNISTTGTCTVALNTPVSIANGGTNDTGTAWTTYTPSMSCNTGSGTWSVTNAGSYKSIGKTFFVSIALLLGNSGTCTGQFTFSLPPGVTAATAATALIRENGLTGTAYQGWSAASNTTMTVGSFTNTGVSYASGDNFISSFVIQAQ
jgi:hypothetical protein